MLIKFVDKTEKNFDSLVGADLTRANLTGANLYGANLIDLSLLP